MGDGLAPGIIPEGVRVVVFAGGIGNGNSEGLGEEEADQNNNQERKDYFFRFFQNCKESLILDLQLFKFTYHWHVVTFVKPILFSADFHSFEGF